MVRAEEHEQFRALLGAGRVIEIRGGEDGFDRRIDMWRHAARARDIHLSRADLASLAGRFVLTTGQVRSVLASASDMAAMAGWETPDASQIAAAARQASDHSLGRLAMKIERKHDWADLVLPAATLQRLREFAAAIRHRHVVFGEWGFGDRIVHGAGIKALFAGASGTGKTMAAGVIARELGLDLFKVDLSGVVSKYIGETEKNLDRVFDAARSSNAIVFLDEAEAILGKRSEVRDAHDRYANIEVAYLLQRLEEHDGVVILATNLRRNIDEAFNRRMQYVIDFPRPEEAERERIWRGMFPPQSPIGADVDFRFLARQFDLAGGEIRNVALDAAFIAAQEHGAIDMRAIVEALSRQLAKQGKTPTGTDFRQYQRLRPVAGGKPESR
jgi:SpoVK/Ycf46/Vps4 family AAA+-type ATPase